MPKPTETRIPDIEGVLTYGNSDLFFPSSDWRKFVQALHRFTEVAAELPQSLELQRFVDLVNGYTERPPADAWGRLVAAVARAIAFHDFPQPHEVATMQEIILTLFTDTATHAKALRFFMITTVLMEKAPNWDPRGAQNIGPWWQPPVPADAAPGPGQLHGALNRYYFLLTPGPGGRLPDLDPSDRDLGRPPGFQFLVERLHDRDPNRVEHWVLKPEPYSVRLPKRSWRLPLRAMLRRWLSGFAFPRKWRGPWSIRAAVWTLCTILILLALVTAIWVLIQPPYVG